MWKVNIEILKRKSAITFPLGRAPRYVRTFSGRNPVKIMDGQG